MGQFPNCRALDKGGCMRMMLRYVAEDRALEKWMEWIKMVER